MGLIYLLCGLAGIVIIVFTIDVFGRIRKGLEIRLLRLLILCGAGVGVSILGFLLLMTPTK